MKNRMLQIAVALALLAATGVTQARGLPEFMNAQQLTVWRAQHAAPPAGSSQAPDEQTQFFTGKPYDAASGTYLFKYRAYSPDLARWTCADPSGFPDGANNRIYVANEPMQCIDRLGLDIDNTKGTKPVWYKDEDSDAVFMVPPGVKLTGYHDGIVEPNTGDVYKTPGKKKLHYQNNVWFDENNNVHGVTGLFNGGKKDDVFRREHPDWEKLFKKGDLIKSRLSE